MGAAKMLGVKPEDVKSIMRAAAAGVNRQFDLAVRQAPKGAIIGGWPGWEKSV